MRRARAGSLLARATSVACITGACVLLAGCGGDSDRLSRDEFVSRANAACKRAFDRLQRLKPARSFKDLVPISEQLIAIGNELYARLRRLKPPAKDAKQFARYLRHLRAGIDKYAELKLADQRRDIASARRVLNEIAANPSGQEAVNLRLKWCAGQARPRS